MRKNTESRFQSQGQNGANKFLVVGCQVQHTLCVSRVSCWRHALLWAARSIRRLNTALTFGGRSIPLQTVSGWYAISKHSLLI